MIRTGLRLLPCLGVLALAACAGLGSRVGAGQSLQLSQVSAVDPVLRASMRLVVGGLDADVGGQPELALAQYERALQVDPTNPYAYLAIARNRVEHDDPASALPFLDQAEAILQARGELSPGAEAHLLGLRANALQAQGQRREADALLASARQLEPRAWSDGRLSAAELR